MWDRRRGIADGTGHGIQRSPRLLACKLESFTAEVKTRKDAKANVHISYVLSLFFHSIPKLACNVQLLRALNGLLLNTTLFTCAFMYRDAITSPQTTQVRRSQNGPSRSLQKLSADLHTALNIALFPPLFFFSGLYYTDVASTAFALAFLTVYFRRTKAVSGDRFLALLLNIVVESLVLKGKGPIGTIIIFLAGQIGPAVNSSDENDGAVSSEKPHQSRVPGKWAFPDMLLVGYGIVAICLRQTNIFWVTVFPAGLSLASFLRAQKGSSNDSLDKLLKRSWNDQTGFDPPTGASSVLGEQCTSMSRRPALTKQTLSRALCPWSSRRYRSWYRAAVA